MRSLANEARAARHAAVLDEATVEFNREGVSGANLSKIARRVGITRAGLYNYCVDRQDLVHQCYLRACKSFKSDLLRAEQTPGNSLDRVIAFVKLVLNADHPPVAVITELGFLNPQQEASVRAARGETVAAMRALLAQGVKEGSIRSCDLDIVTQALLGMLTWTTVSRVWTADTDDTLGARMAAMAPQIILEGVAADGADIPPSRAGLAGILPPPPNSERDERLEALARAGSHLFNRRGIDGVSLDDVAAELGATKGALYHYFDSKPAFVAHCYDRAFDIISRIIDAAGTGATGLECMMMVVDLSVQAQLEDIHILWPSSGFGGLPAPLQKRLLERSNFLVGRSAELTRRGWVDGTIKPWEVAPMRHLTSGAHALLTQWLPLGGKHSAKEIGREISRFLCLGLIARAKPRPRQRSVGALATAK
jgi:AcrR family transcriptional regulator